MQDLPTPNVRILCTCIADYDEFKEIGVWTHVFVFKVFLRDYIIDYKCEIFNILCYENIEFYVNKSWLDILD